MINKKFTTFITFGATLGVLAGCSDTAKSEEEALSTESGDYSIATVRWSDWGDDFVKGFVEETEENAGIEIDWEIYLNSDWGDKKAVLMAGGDLPDAFLGSNALSDAEIAQFADMFIPLEDLIEENMPYLVAAMAEDPQLRAISTSPDGHIYSLPTKLPLRPVAGNQMFINQQWLDNLGLEMPDTVEEFEMVLTAFKEQDANGNGDPNDEIPFSSDGADVLSFLLPFGMTKGVNDGRGLLALRNDETVYLPTSEGYRDGIAWMHKAYQDGLVDPELFTHDASMSLAKRQNKDISLVGVSAGWTPDAVFGPNKDEYVALTPLQGPDGNRYVHTDAAVYSRRELLVTTEAENPAKLLQWADQFYTEDASIQTFYGSFGLAVDKEEDGTYTVLAPPEGESADTFAWVNSFRDFGPKYISEGFNDKVSLNEESGDGLKLKLDAEINQYATEQYPSVVYTSEELGRLSTLNVDIGSYVSSMQAKWIVEGGVEEEWDTYMSTLEKMGYDEFMEIQQTALERYQSNLVNN